MHSKKTQSYWQANITLIRHLLIIWAFISFGTAIALAKVLNQFELGRLPFGFWMAQQGTLLIFVGLIFVYAFKMKNLDRIHDSKPVQDDQHSAVESD
ncbi:MAG: DUF4212 domain-containing protein [Cyanobacteria bacterium P01_F01_bin.86]